MRRKQKNRILNGLMVLCIVALAIAGLLVAGHIKKQSEQGTEAETVSTISARETSKEQVHDGESELAVPEGPTCTIEIRCDTILDHLDLLNDAKKSYVPSDGCILSATTVAFSEGESVFDILRRVCEEKDIQLEYSWTPVYDSYYIEGIHQLYEFDCGNESGWMYKVNEVFPNYGCSSYEPKAGDSIVFLYTCKGYGADIGGKVSG